MRRVVVHVGLSKAASTSLQEALAASRAALAAAGAAYPAIGGGGVKEQKPVRAALGGDAAAAATVRQALAGLAAETLVLSGETLFKYGPDAVQKLLVGTPYADAALSAVAIVREPAGWLNSRYAFQATGFRLAERFAPFAHAELRVADFAKMFTPWQGVLTALPLSDRRDPAPVVARAFAAMGLTVTPPRLDGRKPAPDPRTVEVARRVAAKLSGRAGDPAARRRLLERAAALGWDGRFNGLTPELARTIAARTEASRQTFARASWGSDWDSVCAMPDPEAFVANEWAGGADEAAIAALADELTPTVAPGRTSVLGWLVGRARRVGRGS